MKTILIIGASRGLGLETVRQGLEAGYHVRALARSANEIAINHPELEKISASVLDKQDLARAVDNTDAVISTLGILPSLERVTLFSRAARNLVEVMGACGVKRLIAVTGIGTGDSRGVGGPLFTNLFQPLFLGRIHEDKDREEEIIKESALDWTIVRPGFLTRFPKAGRYSALNDPQDWKGGFITRGDVADFLLKIVGDGSHIGQTPLLIS